MQHYVHAEGFEGRQLMIESAGFFSGPRLLLDGQPAAKGAAVGGLDEDLHSLGGQGLGHRAVHRAGGGKVRPAGVGKPG